MYHRVKSWLCERLHDKHYVFTENTQFPNTVQFYGFFSANPLKFILSYHWSQLWSLIVIFPLYFMFLNCSRYSLLWSGWWKGECDIIHLLSCSGMRIMDDVVCVCFRLAKCASFRELCLANAGVQQSLLISNLSNMSTLHTTQSALFIKSLVPPNLCILILNMSTICQADQEKL